MWMTYIAQRAPGVGVLVDFYGFLTPTIEGGRFTQEGNGLAASIHEAGARIVGHEGLPGRLSVRLKTGGRPVPRRRIRGEARLKLELQPPQPTPKVGVDRLDILVTGDDLGHQDDH